MATIGVVGAGIAGLVCAQALQQYGHQVVVYEKSRGVGGRMATRRLASTCADHGVRYLEPEGEALRYLLGVLHDHHVVRAWRGAIAQMLSDGSCHFLAPSRRYIAREGVNAVAKWLAVGLDIRRQHRVTAIAPVAQQGWQITFADEQPDTWADALVLAIPAPQAVDLLTPLTPLGLPLPVLDAVRAVEFSPCISAIATYSHEQGEFLDYSQAWHGIQFDTHPDLAWISFETSKRPSLIPDKATPPVFVFQSTAAFADRYQNAQDLQPAGMTLVQQAAQALYDWLDQPVDLYVHRWRYAFAQRPYPGPYIATQTPLPLLCSGDWCGGQQVGGAIASGLQAATYFQQKLGDTPAALSFYELVQALCDRPSAESA
ncbi:MAG: FAD-dependent oxidoreductase [Elainellaceae cyanobacterium]